MNKVYKVVYSHQFKKSAKKLNAKDRQAVSAIIDRLAAGKQLEARYRDHALKGELRSFRECHVRPDLLLLYQINDDMLVLKAIDVGSHSSLF